MTLGEKRLKKREADRRRYERDRERILERRKERYERDRERILERQKEYHATRGCVLEAERRKREDVRAAKREADRLYRERNRERILERKREYHATRGRILQKERRQRDPEKYRQANREMNERRKERSREYRRRVWGERREEDRARNRNYKRRDPAANRAREHRRRARKLANGGDFTSAEWGALCEHFGNVCLACGAGGLLTIDHVLPVSRGGRNDIENLQPLCKSCNVRKGQRYVDYRDAGGLAAFVSTMRGATA